MLLLLEVSGPRWVLLGFVDDSIGKYTENPPSLLLPSSYVIGSKLCYFLIFRVIAALLTLFIDFLGT